MSKIYHIKGKAIILPEDDMDTDRIIPVRFIRSITFDGLGSGVFGNDRENARRDGIAHPFEDPRYKGASILFTGNNFGCGSSREHAVHALMKWGQNNGYPGIRAIVAYGKYSEIFFSNSLANGLPTVLVEKADWEKAVQCLQKNSKQEVMVDIEKMQLLMSFCTFPITFQQPSAREMFTAGTWDRLGVLLEAKDTVEKVIGRLPYVQK